MKPFIHENFLLESELSQRLYHEVAEDLPVIDFHNHLDPVRLAHNTPFRNITGLWIDPDPYKHRAMRINAIPEDGITGTATDREKFNNWAQTLPKTLGNPLFHWSCLELKRVFGIEVLLNNESADQIWQNCNLQIEEPNLLPSAILQKYKVELLCTSDDLLDDLQPHITASRHDGFKVLPSLRGDSMLAFDQPEFKKWLTKLSGLSDVSIETLDDYEKAIISRLDDFSEAGCRFTDHALNSGFKFTLPTKATAEALFQKFLLGHNTDAEQGMLLKSYLLFFLGKAYARRNWVMQLHVGALRHTSSRLRRLAGSNGGYAAIGNVADIESIANLLNQLEKDENLPKIILYTLNPADNEVFASLTGSYAEDGVAGKIQFGPAWWYNDHHQGIQDHLITLANYGLLYHFIGMTTDSRSFLSFSRHEYFRRILCNLMGKWVKAGYMPDEFELVAATVKAVCYHNIKNRINEINKIHVNEKIKG